MIADAFDLVPGKIYEEDLDGSGFSLTIPTLLIEHSAVDDNLVDALSQSKVTLQVVLDISKADDKIIEVSLWYGSTLDLPRKLIE